MFGITVILTKPHLVSVVRTKALIFIGNVADWQLVQGGGGERGEGDGRPSNNTPTGQRKMWKKHEQLTWKFQWKSCSTSHLHFLWTNSIITGGLFTINIPTKMKKKKGGEWEQDSQKVKGSLSTPKQSIFPPVHAWTSEGICYNNRQCRAWLVHKALGSFSSFGQMIRKQLEHMYPV